MTPEVTAVAEVVHQISQQGPNESCYIVDWKGRKWSYPTMFDLKCHQNSWGGMHNNVTFMGSWMLCTTGQPNRKLSMIEFLGLVVAMSATNRN